MNYKRLFFDFLRKRGTLELYKRNFKEYRNLHTFNDVFPRNNLNLDFIMNAFSWYRTPEGHCYWKSLHNEWAAFCYKYLQFKRFNS